MPEQLHTYPWTNGPNPQYDKIQEKETHIIIIHDIFLFQYRIDDKIHQNVIAVRSNPIGYIKTLEYPLPYVEYRPCDGHKYTPGTDQ